MFPSSSASGGFYLKNVALSKTLLTTVSRLMCMRLYYLAIAFASVVLPLFALPKINTCNGSFLANSIKSYLKGF
jgi:hypothetical protein